MALDVPLTYALSPTPRLPRALSCEPGPLAKYRHDVTRGGRESQARCPEEGAKER